jgi:glycosyltransferase involved in cell wall biosynthesis
MYLDNLVFSLFVLAVLPWLHIKERIHLVYVGNTFPWFLGLLFKGFFFVKWVTDINEVPELQGEWMKMEERHQPLRAAYYRCKGIVSRHLFRYADLIIALGVDLEDGVPKALTGSYRVSPEKILPVPLGVSLKTTDMHSKKDRPELSFFDILYAGYLRRGRGIDNLLMAVRSLQERAPDVKLTLVGGFVNEGERLIIEAMMEDLIDQDKVEYIGTVPHDKALDFIHRADLCVCPFPKEDVFEHAYTLKVPEYLAMGKPVVATDLACMRRLITHGENGFLTRSNEPGELADAIYLLYSDAGLRAHLEKHARQSVLAYDWDKLNARVDQRIRALVP